MADADRKYGEAAEELTDSLQVLWPNADPGDVQGVVDGIAEMIRLQPTERRTSGRPDVHTPGSSRWYAARMVPTKNTAEDIEQARQQLNGLTRRQLVDLIQQLATEVEQ